MSSGDGEGALPPVAAAAPVAEEEAVVPLPVPLVLPVRWSFHSAKERGGTRYSLRCATVPVDGCATVPVVDGLRECAAAAAAGAAAAAVVGLLIVE